MLRIILGTILLKKRLFDSRNLSYFFRKSRKFPVHIVWIVSAVVVHFDLNLHVFVFLTNLNELCFSWFSCDFLSSNAHFLILFCDDFWIWMKIKSNFISIRFCYRYLSIPFVERLFTMSVRIRTAYRVLRYIINNTLRIQTI